jgi:hypothetical protein
VSLFAWRSLLVGDLLQEAGPLHRCSIVRWIRLRLDSTMEQYATVAAICRSSVLKKMWEILPDALRTRLPAARAEFEARCVRAWGSADCGSATTSIPNVP